MKKTDKKIKVCHFANVHTIDDTRVFSRECVSLAKYFDTTLIGIGNYTGVKQGVKVVGIKKPANRIVRVCFTSWLVFFKALRVNAKIYHIHDAELLLFGILLSVVFRKKVIYDIHENTYEDIRHKPWIPKSLKGILSFGYSFQEWLASWFMHFILVIAKPEFASNFNKRRYTSIQNFAEIAFFKDFRVDKRSELSGNHIFYIGTVHDMYYDFNNVVEAIYILKQRGIEVILHCVGYAKFYLNNDLPKVSCYEEVKSQIIFYGHLDMEDGYEISKVCKLGLCLKDQPAPILVSHERKFFEYIAVGLPIICCDSHIYTESLKKYKVGRAVDLSTPKSLADGIRTMLSDGRILDKMQQHCIDAAEEEYNWESQEKILVELYRSFLN